MDTLRPPLHEEKRPVAAIWTIVLDRFRQLLDGNQNMAGNFRTPECRRRTAVELGVSLTHLGLKTLRGSLKFRQRHDV